MTFKPVDITDPDHVVYSTQAGIKIFFDYKLIGIQFIDEDGKQIFIALPGKVLAFLAASIRTLLSNHPESIAYTARRPDPKTKTN
jgi:hypothetical protein